MSAPEHDPPPSWTLLPGILVFATLLLVVSRYFAAAAGWLPPIDWSRFGL